MRANVIREPTTMTAIFHGGNGAQFPQGGGGGGGGGVGKLLRVGRVGTSNEDGKDSCESPDFCEDKIALDSLDEGNADL